MSEETQEPIKDEAAAQMSTEEAMRILQTKNQENLMACDKEIQEILNKYGFSLEVQQTIAILPRK